MRAAARDFRHTWWPPSMSVSLYLSRALSLPLSPSLSGCRSVRRKGHGPPGGDRASRMTSCSIHRPHGHVVQRLAMPRKSSRCAIVNLRGMGAPGSDRWVVLTCLLPAAPVAFRADRWPSHSIGELQEMPLRSAVLQVEQQHCSIW